MADVVPFTYVGGWPGDISWNSISSVLPWEVWRRSGDDSLVSKYYNLSRANVDFFVANGNPDARGLAQFGFYGDWLAIERTSKPQVTAASFIRSISNVVDMATHLGLSADIVKYQNLLVAMKTAYHETYFQSSAGVYQGNSQTANLLPLAMNITPASSIDSVAKSLTASVLGNNNGTKSGIVGFAYVLDALMAVHRPDLALAMVLKTDFPSLAHMIQVSGRHDVTVTFNNDKVGPGTIWEAWNGQTSSKNHPALTASIGRFIHEHVGGIQHFKFQISSQVALRVGHCRAWRNFATGHFAVSWKSTERQFWLNATVPPNQPQPTEIHLPVHTSFNDQALLFESGLELARCSALTCTNFRNDKNMLSGRVGVLNVERNSGSIIVTASSGKFSFHLHL